MTRQDPFEIGAEVRERRRQLGLSVRALAARAAISPAYVTAIEAARNPTTGKPPALSLAIVQRLAEALEIDVATLTSVADTSAHHGDHVLAYVLRPPPGGILAALDEKYAAVVDHWLHIVDPRIPGVESTERATVARFPLGAYPYETPFLQPDALLGAVDDVVRELAQTHRGRRVGLLVDDGGAVMRYLGRAACAVELEETWHADVTRIWQERLGGPPAVDVCSYHHADIDSLGLTIDRLETMLDLIRHHDYVLVIDAEDGTIVGAPAVRRMLALSRPQGASTRAWQRLTDAAARTLVGAHGPTSATD